jgi:rubrerythrin
MKNFSHILQKAGVLKTFTVAKIVNKKEIEDLKKLIREVASNEREYKQMLQEELVKLSNMHDSKNPIPGIIYNEKEITNHQLIRTITLKFSENIKQQNFKKRELALLISSIINQLDLTQEDFKNLKRDLETGNEEDEEWDDEYDSEDEYED